MPKIFDAELISELFDTYRQMMFKIAMNILHNGSDAEDAVQDAFLWIINNYERVAKIPSREMEFYFVAIVENISINKLNTKKRHLMYDIDDHREVASDYSIEETAEGIFLVEDIKSALNELSDRDYSIMYLYLFKQMTPREVAEYLDISEKNIYTYIIRARKRLIKILNKRGIEHDL